MPGVRLSLPALAVLAALVGCAKDEAPPAPRKSVTRLVEEAVSEDEAVRVTALTALLQRGSSEATDAFVARLHDPDPAVVARSIEGLVALQDQGGVPGLIELSREDRPELALRAVIAIGQIGGREAEGYLFTLETGAKKEAFRRTAAQSRLQLRRRRAARGAATGSAPETIE